MPVTQMSSSGSYVSLTTNLYQTPWLGHLPLSTAEGLTTYDVSDYVPDSAIAIVVYIFLTVQNAAGTPRRAAYEVFTEDHEGNHYSQLMNAVFTKHDVAINSENFFLPLHEKEFSIHLPFEEPLAEAMDEEMEQVRKRRKRYANLAEAMQAFTASDEDQVFGDVFLLGYFV